MRIFAIKQFYRWAQGSEVTDESLRGAVDEIEKGLVDANLGGNLYKKRIATKGKGKSGSVRTLLIYVEGQKTFYFYGFAKADQGNVSPKEEKALKILGKEYLTFDDAKLASLIKDGALIEITKGKE
jgi:hypothetical protein